SILINHTIPQYHISINSTRISRRNRHVERTSRTQLLAILLNREIIFSSSDYREFVATAVSSHHRSIGGDHGTSIIDFDKGKLHISGDDIRIFVLKTSSINAYFSALLGSNINTVLRSECCCLCDIIQGLLPKFFKFSCGWWRKAEVVFIIFTRCSQYGRATYHCE